MTDQNMILFVASYADVADAEADWEAVKLLHRAGDLGHVSAGIVAKNADGTLTLVRHDTTAKHLAWGGVIVGATLGVLFPPLGYAALAGGALDAAVLGTAGGLSGHLWTAIPRDDLRELGGILEAGQAALAVIAVDKVQDEVDAVITRSARKAAKKFDKGDIDGALDALEKGADLATAIEE